MNHRICLVSDKFNLIASGRKKFTCVNTPAPWQIYDTITFVELHQETHIRTGQMFVASISYIEDLPTSDPDSIYHVLAIEPDQPYHNIHTPVIPHDLSPTFTAPANQNNKPKKGETPCSAS